MGCGVDGGEQYEGGPPRLDCEVEEDASRVHEGVGELDHEKAGAKFTAAAVVSVAAFEH